MIPYGPPTPPSRGDPTHPKVHPLVFPDWGILGVGGAGRGWGAYTGITLMQTHTALD